jgi:NADH-quinone oxidoreductase subunit A
MTQQMLAEYFPILVFLGIAAAIAGAMVGGAMLVARQKPDPEKLSAYECGFEPFDDTRRRFDVRFYPSRSSSSSSIWKWPSCSPGLSA